MHSIIVPCYKSSQSIRKVVELTAQELTRLGILEYEFVLVNDCSPDEGKTWEAIKELTQDYKFVKGINLARNAGQHNAQMAGFNHAEGDVIIGMDDDLQTHPSQLHILLEELEKGYDIVYGYYPEKKHGFVRNIISKLNSWSVRVLIGKPKWMKTSSYWVMRKFVRDSIIQYKHSFTYMQGLFLRSTRNISCVPIEHYDREYGESGYTFKKLFTVWSSIIGFSIVPLRIVTIIGFICAIMGFLGAVGVVIAKLMSPHMVVGWASLITAICFFSGMIILVTGLVGEYIGRLYLSINAEPQYVIREKIHCSEKD